MIENILIIDVETNGLHPEKGDAIIEIGAILYNIKHKTILQSCSSLFPCESNPVEHINGISSASSLERYCTDTFLIMLGGMFGANIPFVAHNAQFDKKFLHGFRMIQEGKWICTKSDFQWPVKLTRYRLQDVCDAMGVPYIDAHRALADCDLLAKCFNKVPDLQQRIEWAAGKFK